MYACNFWLVAKKDEKETKEMYVRNLQINKKKLTRTVNKKKKNIRIFSVAIVFTFHINHFEKMNLS